LRISRLVWMTRSARHRKRISSDCCTVCESRARRSNGADVVLRGGTVLAFDGACRSALVEVRAVLTSFFACPPRTSGSAREQSCAWPRRSGACPCSSALFRAVSSAGPPRASSHAWRCARPSTNGSNSRTARRSDN